MCKKVILGLSGGMDSAYVAIKLLEKGYDVTALNIIMCDSCDSSEQSRALAKSLGLRFDVVDAREEFDRLVINPFVSSYVSGTTPNPCVLCNPSVKFGKLFEYMETHGADYVATGHYSVPVQLDGRWSFAPAKDTAKDQGYFLYGIPQWMLSHLIMPLGDVLKSEIKAFFAEGGSSAAPPKTESTDICFVSGKSYTDIITEHSVLPPVGNFVDENGKVLGKHKGIHSYTVGQRKGLGIALGKPAYVSKINAEDNTVTLSVSTALIDGFSLAFPKFMSVSAVAVGERYSVRVRYRARPVQCTVKAVEDGRIDLAFSEPQAPVAPGQSAVFYDGNGVIAFGGIIV